MDKQVFMAFLAISISLASPIVGFARAADASILPPSVTAQASVMPPAMLWNSTFGTGNADLATCVIQTTDGGYAVVGSLGNGYWPRTAFLAKTDASGKMQWSQTFTGVTNAVAVFQTGDAGFVIGGTGNAGVILVKIDSRGTVQWNQTCLITYQWSEGGNALAMIQANDGGYVIVGSCTPYLVGQASNNGFALKVDSTGKMQWNKIYGGVGIDYFNAVTQTTDCGYALAGATTSFGFGGYDFWLVKIDSAGNPLWSRTFGQGPGTIDPRTPNSGEVGDDKATSILQATDGDLLLAGNTYSLEGSKPEAWIIKTDAMGNTVWNKTYIEAGGVQLKSLIQTSDGGFAFAGSTRRWVQEGTMEVYIVKTDDNGKREWNQTFGVATTADFNLSDDNANWLIEADDGSLVIAGSTNPGASSHGGFLYLVKTTAFLTPPSPRLSPFPNNGGTLGTSTPPSFSFPRITIGSDGTISPAAAPVARCGNVYTFTANYVGLLLVLKNGVEVDGAGHSIQGNGTLGDFYVQASERGITLSGVANVIVKNFQVNGFLVAIYLSDSSYSTISANGLTMNSQAIYITGTSAYNKISQNNIFLNAEQAIWLNQTNNNVISANIIKNNSIGSGINGIAVNGDNNTISGNVIDNNGIGITLYGAQHSTVTGNNITNNDEAGLALWSGTANTQVYLNNFVNDTTMADLHDIYGAYNAWDNGSKGNYWTDTTRIDANGDGISDTPITLIDREGSEGFSFSANNTDHYPLMAPINISYPAFDPPIPPAPDALAIKSTPSAPNTTATDSTVVLAKSPLQQSPTNSSTTLYGAASTAIAVFSLIIIALGIVVTRRK